MKLPVIITAVALATAVPIAAHAGSQIPSSTAPSVAKQPVVNSQAVRGREPPIRGREPPVRGREPPVRGRIPPIRGPVASAPQVILKPIISPLSPAVRAPRAPIVAPRAPAK